MRKIFLWIAVLIAVVLAISVLKVGMVETFFSVVGILGIIAGVFTVIAGIGSFFINEKDIDDVNSKK